MIPTTKYSLVLAALAVSLICYTSCRKKSNTTVNPAAVTIAVQSPAKGQIFHKGDTVNIVGNVTYVSELHGYYLQIIDTTAEKVVFENAVDIHNDHFVIQQAWVDTCSQSRSLLLIISANLDHSGTQASDTTWIITRP